MFETVPTLILANSYRRLVSIFDKVIQKFNIYLNKLTAMSLDKNTKIKTDSLDITYCIIYILKKTAAKLLKLNFQYNCRLIRKCRNSLSSSSIRLSLLSGLIMYAKAFISDSVSSPGITI